MGNEWDLEEDGQDRRPWHWYRLGAYALGWVLYLPLASVLGWLRWFPAGRAYTPGAAFKTVIYGVLCLAAVHVLLVWPITKMAYPQRLGAMPRWLRLSIGAVLQALPLFSFGLFLGAGQGSESGLNLALTLLPLAVLATTLFEVTEESWVASAVLAFGAFLSFYFVNDVLDGMPVLVNFAAKEPAFFLWRSIWPVAFVSAVLCLELGLPREKTTLALLAVLSAAVGAVLLVGSYLPRDVTAFAFVPAITFLWLGGERSRLFGAVVAIAAGLVSLFWLYQDMIGARYEFWFLLRTLSHVVSTIVAGLWTIALLPKPSLSISAQDRLRRAAP